MLSPDFVVALRLALRARFLSFAAWSLVLMLGSAYLASMFAGRQPATVGLDVGLSVIRLVLPLLAVLLLQELLSREFDRKLFLTSLTYPRARHRFLLGRVAAIALLILIVLAVAAVLLASLTGWLARGYPQATPPALGATYIVAVSFVALDLLIVLAIGTLTSVVARTPSFVLVGTLGFMLVARSYSVIVALLERDTTLVDNAPTYQSSLALLGYLLPDLASLDVRMIALYGHWQFLPADWLPRVVAALAYAAAIFALATWAFNRRRFD